MASSRKLGVALMQFNRAFRRYADRATADLPSMPLTGVQGWWSGICTYAESAVGMFFNGILRRNSSSVVPRSRRHFVRWKPMA